MKRYQIAYFVLDQWCSCIAEVGDDEDPWQAFLEGKEKSLYELQYIIPLEDETDEACEQGAEDGGGDSLEKPRKGILETLKAIAMPKRRDVHRVRKPNGATIREYRFVSDAASDDETEAVQLLEHE